jgi:hypothetical protein
LHTFSSYGSTAFANLYRAHTDTPLEVRGGGVVSFVFLLNRVVGQVDVRVINVGLLVAVPRCSGAG